MLRFCRPFAFFGFVGIVLALLAVVLTAALPLFGIALVLDAVKKQSGRTYSTSRYSFPNRILV